MKRVKKVPSFVKNLKPRASMNGRKSFEPKLVKSRPKMMAGRGSVPGVNQPTERKGFNLTSLATIDEMNLNLRSFDKNRLSGAVTLASSGEMDAKSPTARMRANTENEPFLRSVPSLQLSKLQSASGRVAKSEIREDLDELFSEPGSPLVFARSPEYSKLAKALDGLF